MLLRRPGRGYASCPHGTDPGHPEAPLADLRQEESKDRPQAHRRWDLRRGTALLGGHLCRRGQGTFTIRRGRPGRCARTADRHRSHLRGLHVGLYGNP